MESEVCEILILISVRYVVPASYGTGSLSLEGSSERRLCLRRQRIMLGGTCDIRMSM
jgi:hypothetical protein